MDNTVLLSSTLFIIGGIIVIAVPAIIAYIIGAVLILKGIIDLFEVTFEEGRKNKR